MRAKGVTLVLLGILSPAVALAEPQAAGATAALKQSAPTAPATTVTATAAPATPAPASDPLREPAVDEVLRAARLELLALVERDAQRSASADDDAPQAHEGSVTLGALPPSMTSAVPALERAAAPASSDLRWLEGIALPDFTVRWDNRLVRTLDFYRNDARGRAQARTLLAKQGRYGAMIREKLRAAGLPEDLVYVVMVESAYSPTARSEVGAVGLWQFMTSPAGDYGLEMNTWVDQRMSPEHATVAAIGYFRDLHDELGSWPLAMAAFNMGFGALSRSIQKYNTNDFWLLSNLEAGLPYETIQYVTKIAAFAIIGRNPERFGLQDLVMDPAVRTEEVSVPGGTALSRIARAAGVTPEQIAELNPELKKTRVPPDVPAWTVRVPQGSAARFHEKWQTLPAVASHREHTLRLGERLSDLATAYGTTVSKLQQLNELEAGTVIRAGTKLKVPDVEPIVAEREASPAVGVNGDTFVYADRKRVFYRVASRDDLTEIASFFRITSDEIRMWNQLALDASLQRGMYLQLFVPSEADLSQALVLAPNEVRAIVVGSEEFFDFHETQQNRVRLRYRVKAGDTLRSVAERFELSVGSIARINQFSRDKKLDPDTEIIVYVPQETAKKVATR